MPYLNRRSLIVAFAALVGCLTLAGLAVAITRAQSKDKRYAELRFSDDAAVAAALTHAVFASTTTQGAADLSRRFGAATVSAAAIDSLVRKQKLHYAAVLDESGRVLQTSSGMPDQAALVLRQSPAHIRAVLGGAGFSISSVLRGTGPTTTMEYVAKFATRHGTRIVVDGFHPAAIAGLVSGYLAQIPNHDQVDSYLVDERENAIASAIRGVATERPGIAPEVRRAVADDQRAITPASGPPRVVTTAPVQDTSWRVVSVTNRADLYSHLPGAATPLPWLIFAVLAGAVLAVIWLLVRLVRNASALEAANRGLEHSNVQLAHDALHDTLTGLPNRNLFLDRLEHSLQRARRTEGRQCAVAFLDVDHFKLINDSLGHTTGDRLLVALAQRLLTLVRPGDTVARLGGDEFTVLLDEIDGPDDAAAVIGRLTSGIGEPLSIDGREYFVTVSAGIATGGAGSWSEELIRDADIAMYRAKGDGRARLAVFDPQMHDLVVERAGIQNGLLQALRRGDIDVAYQPIIHLETGRVEAVEALARWQHDDGRMVAPVDFIAVAEESGLIGMLGRQVLEKACATMVDWHARGVVGADVKLWVNVSSRQLVADELIKDVSEVLAATGLAPESLRIELTETALMHDPEGARATMDRLGAAGVRFHIDDFGTGYSSLGQLNELSFEMLKIDRSFITRLDDVGEDNEVVRAIVGLSHSLGHRVVAEGVETEGQLRVLRGMGVDLAQGYLIARPLAAADAEAVLASPLALAA